jgi:hypothetical protein
MGLSSTMFANVTEAPFLALRIIEDFDEFFIETALTLIGLCSEDAVRPELGHQITVVCLASPGEDRLLDASHCWSTRDP